MPKTKLLLTAIGIPIMPMSGCNAATKHETTYSSGNDPKIELTRDGHEWHILINGEDRSAKAGLTVSETIPQTLFAFSLKNAAGIPLPSSFQLQTTGSALSAFCGECNDAYKNWSHSGKN